MKSGLLLLLGAVLALGCGVGSSRSEDSAAFQQLAASASALVEQHQSDAAGEANAASCASEHGRYDEAMRPLLKKMRAMSTGMDSTMMGIGRSAEADLAGTCDSMASELDRHAASSCTSSDMAENLAETARHCDRMKTWLQTEQERARSLAQETAGGCGRCPGCSR